MSRAFCRSGSFVKTGSEILAAAAEILAAAAMESVGLDNTPPPSGASVLEEALAAPKSLTADDAAAGVSDPGESAPSETGGAKVTLAELDTLVTALSFPLAANLEPAAELSMRSLAFGVGGAGGLGGGEGASSSDDWLDFFFFFAFSFFFFFFGT